MTTGRVAGGHEFTTTSVRDASGKLRVRLRPERKSNEHRCPHEAVTHVLPPLPCAENALDPVISADTIVYVKAVLDKLIHWGFAADNLG